MEFWLSYNAYTPYALLAAFVEFTVLIIIMHMASAEMRAQKMRSTIGYKRDCSNTSSILFVVSCSLLFSLIDAVRGDLNFIIPVLQALVMMPKLIDIKWSTLKQLKLEED